MPSTADAPRRAPHVAGKWPALMLAIAVHALFIAVLIFSVRWQNRKPEPVFAELYAPPSKAPVVEAPHPIPPPPPKPQPQSAPEPPPIAKPAPVPPPPIEKPDPHATEIALKAKQEEARRRREQEEQEQREAAKKEADRREADRKRQEEQKRIADARERQMRESDALKAQAQREAQTRVQQQLERETQMREQQRLAQERAAQSAALARAEADYIRRIQAKVRGNLIEPGELIGNPEAIFEVVQLPTGEIIDVKLSRSSGLRAYDDAVERAIRKSSPLPRPAQPEIWQRVLELRVRPRD